MVGSRAEFSDAEVMHFTTLETLGLAAAVIVFITVRQLGWQRVNLSRLLRMPVIFGVLGTISLVSAGRSLPTGWHLHALDVAIIATELAGGVAAGWFMGRLTEIRTVDGVTSSRLTGLGVGVWLGFLALRIELGMFAHIGGAALAELPGTILLVVAGVKVVQALMIRERISAHHAARERSVAESLR